MFENAQEAEGEDIKLMAALHGVKIKGQSSSSNGRDDDNAPIFKDPKEYENMTPEEREIETQRQVAALMRMPFSSKIKGIGNN